MSDFSRRELQGIRDQALQQAQRLGQSNILAMRAYAELAAAADKLDAMLARDEGAQSQRPTPQRAPTTTASVRNQPPPMMELLEDDEDGELEEYDPSA